MQYQAIITDLDGTALDSPQEKIVSVRLAEAVDKLESRGIMVCAATGRAETFAEPVIASMHLRHPAIISGGTRIIEPVSKRELWRCGMNAEQMHAVTDVLRLKSYGCLWNDYSEQDYLSGAWPIDKYDLYDSTYFFEACFIPHDGVDEVVQALEVIPGLSISVAVAQRPHMNDIHISSKDATKEHAIYELEAIINVPKERMIGVGDARNDIHLFNAVGHKVAMGNAVAEVKEMADEVISSVQQDGLAEYFERLAKELES